jgi:hypothetical protein
MSEHRTVIRGVNTNFRAGETEDETVITVETSPRVMPPAWLNFLQQRLHVLHLDYQHIGAERIVVMSTPYAAESVARLVISAMESADHYVKTLKRNMRAHGLEDQIATGDAEQWLQWVRRARNSRHAILGGG